MLSESRIFNINSDSGNKNNGSKNSNISYFLPSFISNLDDDNNNHIDITRDYLNIFIDKATDELTKNIILIV